MRGIVRLIAPVALVGGIAVVACRGATEAIVDIRTDVPCSSVRATAIVAGAPGTTEIGAAATVTSHCEGGEIGMLTLVPSSSKAALLSIKVVLGVDTDVEACTAENAYRGCIVARRRLAYREHETLRLRITMGIICKNIACDELSTCSRLGTCVDAQTEADGTLRGEDDLGDAVAPPVDARDARDGGPSDAGRDADASEDLDAAEPPDEQDGAPPGVADSGPLCNGSRCTAGQGCCNINSSCSASCFIPNNENTMCTGFSSCPPNSYCCLKSFRGDDYTQCRTNPLCNSPSRHWYRVCETAADCISAEAGTTCPPHVGLNYGICGP